MVDMLGNELNVGDTVKVYTLIGKDALICGASKVVGSGKIISLDGIPSRPEGMVWVEDIVSCYHPEAVRLKCRGGNNG